MPPVALYFPKASDGTQVVAALKAAGFEPVTPPDGYSLVALAQSKSCVAAIVGFDLGDEAAPGLVQRLRAGSLGGDFPVLFVGRCSRYEWEQALLDRRRTEYLELPLTPESLADALRSFL